MIVQHTISYYIIRLPGRRDPGRTEKAGFAGLRTGSGYNIYIYIYIHYNTYIHTYIHIYIYIYIYILHATDRLVCSQKGHESPTCCHIMFLVRTCRHNLRCVATC